MYLAEYVSLNAKTFVCPHRFSSCALSSSWPYSMWRFDVDLSSSFTADSSFNKDSWNMLSWLLLLLWWDTTDSSLSSRSKLSRIVCKILLRGFDTRNSVENDFDGEFVWWTDVSKSSNTVTVREEISKICAYTLY